MSHDKAIEHGREHREPYRGNKATDRTCRNGCDCPACRIAREHKIKRQQPVEEPAEGEDER